MRKFVLPAAAVALILLVGLFVPDGLFCGLDGRLAESEWEIAGSERAFPYTGTLENRVRALDAWQNGAPGVRYAAAEIADEDLAQSVWDALYAAELLPTDAKNVSGSVSAFTLMPNQIDARYVYCDVVSQSAGGRLHAIVDRDTGMILRADFICDAQTLISYMKNSGEGFYTEYKPNELIKNYVSLLGYGRFEDIGGEFINGDAIQGMDADIEGTRLAVSLKYAVNQGLLMYKLFARPL